MFSGLEILCLINFMRCYSITSLFQMKSMLINRYDYDVMNSLIHQTIWHGGSESHTFNRLEHIAMMKYPKTPVLGKFYHTKCVL